MTDQSSRKLYPNLFGAPRLSARQDRPAPTEDAAAEAADEGKTTDQPEADPAESEGRGGRRKGRANRKGGGRQAKATPEPKVVVRPLAPRATVQPRHWGLLLSFVLLVFLPLGAAAWYLWTRAADQYASTLGFTVRSEELASASDLLGGLGAALGGGGGSHDSDILYEFVRSQELVATLDERLDLRGLYSRHHETDPLLSFDPDGTIEDLTDYWERMLRISYDAGTGLMELRVLAFDPQEAQDIARAVFDESSKMINELSVIAREDATRYAEEDLDRAIERLKEAREALTAFRLESQIVDPTADIQGQMGLLNTLQSQLAEALIEYDLLTGSTTSNNDPRLSQAQRRIEVIRERMEEERAKFGASGQGPGGDTYASTIAEFERLTVDREFAEQSYTAALTALDAARAEAARQSRYLAAYIRPTLAQSSEFPQRWLMLALVGLFGFLAWAISGLVYYSLRDRR